MGKKQQIKVTAVFSGDGYRAAGPTIFIINFLLISFVYKTSENCEKCPSQLLNTQGDVFMCLLLSY